MKNWRVFVTVFVVLVGAAGVGYLAARSDKSSAAVSPPSGDPAASAEPAAPAVSTPDQPPPEPAQEQPAVSPAPAATAAPEAAAEPAQVQAVVPAVPVSAEAEPTATEVLTSGPVHEAFAAPVDLQAQAGLVAPSEPPADVEETPPAEQPEGGNMIWVPGYWAWDADRRSFIWISGCWRVVPPNTYWVPGYWTQAAGGWAWVAGYWAPVTVQEVQYLPVPPAAEGLEPATPPPSPDDIWVPPCSYWYQGGYVPRPGYWLAAQPDWIWMPSYYCWTPRGCVFVNGYWDYPLQRRGLLFSPVYFASPVYSMPGYVYSPAIVVDLGLLPVNLFCYPHYGHYYFGDFYDNSYLSLGIYPWFDCHRNRTWWCPLYDHDRWQFGRSEPGWEDHRRQDYDHSRNNKDLRPPRTFQEMQVRVASAPAPQARALQVAQPLNTFVAAPTTHVKFQPIDTGTRHQIAQQSSVAHRPPGEQERTESPVVQAGGRPSAERPTGNPPAQHAGTVTWPPARKAPAAPPGERNVTVAAPVPAPRGPFDDNQSKAEVASALARVQENRRASAAVAPPSGATRAVTPAQPMSVPAAVAQRANAPASPKALPATPARPVMPAPAQPVQTPPPAERTISPAPQPSAAPAAAERTLTPRTEPRYIPPPPQPRVVAPPVRQYTPPAAPPPTVFDDTTSRNDANQETSRGHKSMGH